MNQDQGVAPGIDPGADERTRWADGQPIPNYDTSGDGLVDIAGIFVGGCCFVSWEQMTLPMEEESDG